jgi:L-asparaginase II
MSAQLVPLVERTRFARAGDAASATSECLHFGALAHVNAKGELLSFAGTPGNALWRSFTRSTLKAFQALPFVRAGGLQRFGLDTQQTALLCASHNGEEAHVQAAQAILDAAQTPYQKLACGCHVPGIFSYLNRPPPEGLIYDERHNNCSGKHSGMLAHCVQSGWSLDGYIDTAHPLQQAIAQDVAQVCGIDVAQMDVGIDGCSAPNFAMPMANLAWGYARMAAAAGGREASGVERWSESLAALGNAMSAEPFMVSGTGRNDLAFMQAGAGDWITKVGADGVQVVASKSRGEAIAIKISDADKPALYAAIVGALDALGWLDAAQRQALAPWCEREIKNANGWHVGERRMAAAIERQAAPKPLASVAA